MNSKGEMVIAEKFNVTFPFKGGLAYVEENEKPGYINTKGEYVWESK